MNGKEAKRLIRKAAGVGVCGEEREALKRHFAAESDALAEACRQRKLARKSREARAQY